MVPNFKTKLNLLMHLLEGDEMKRVMVFVRTKTDATTMGKFMARSNVGEIRFLHSNIGQNSRMNAIKDFKDGNVRILVSTDVTARGIDVFEVSHVVNFQVPGHYEDYVHRIGRTGRADAYGEAVTFIIPDDQVKFKKIEMLIQQDVEKLPVSENYGAVPEYNPMLKGKGNSSPRHGGHGGGGGGKRNYKPKYQSNNRGGENKKGA
jgi:ATP-dependent RNA helicase RhlE